MPCSLTEEGLDAEQFYPPAVSSIDVPALEAAAEAYMAGMEPAPHHRRVEILTKLAMRYPVSARAEEDDSTARMLLLVEDLAHLPVDILDAACRAAALTSKFMPTAAEIMEHARPQLLERRTRAWRLRKLAFDARSIPAPAEPLSPEAQAELEAEIGGLLDRMKSKRAADEPPPADASPEEKRRWRESRPPVDWEARTRSDLASTNLMRAIDGAPPLTREQYDEMMMRKLFPNQRRDGLDPDIAAVF